jgi:hypothetical protein
MCGGKRQDFGRFGVSRDVIENEGSYAFLRQSVIKLNSLKYKVLFGFIGGQEGENKGDPENEGESKDVYENKGQEKTPGGCLKMLLKISDLSVFLEM